MIDSTVRKRIFVVDHMCVLPYGHSQASVALFRRELEAYFTESHALVPRALSANSAKKKRFTRCLNYPYNWIHYRRFDFLLNRCLKSQWLRIRLQSRLRLLEADLPRRLARLLGFDPVLRKTERNWERHFKHYGMGSDDLIFFPSTDYYGAAACLGLIMKGKTTDRPRLHLRMIGVMEDACLTSRTARSLLMEKVKEALAQGVDVQVSSETPAYGSYLAEKLGVEVNYFPQPLSGDAISMPAAEPAIAVCMGSARSDKGYFLMKEIAGKTALHCGKRVAFEIQSMPASEDASTPEYDHDLAKAPNVRLLPAILPQGEMFGWYRRSYVVLLPYDPKVYEHRGSAIFQESVAFARPVVCLAGAAFAELVERYQNGYTCRDTDEFAAAVEDCISIAPSEWDRRLEISRRLYQNDAREAIGRVLVGRQRNPSKAVQDKLA
jgi:glycosyltransferase involved in cell wall biosynthesis